MGGMARLIPAKAGASLGSIRTPASLADPDALERNFERTARVGESRRFRLAE
jgi:hypothetical protein